MKNITDYIRVFDGVVTNNLCDAILEEYANSQEWAPTYVRTGVVSEIRSAWTIPISLKEVISVNYSVREKLDRYMFASASYAIQNYNKIFSSCHIEQDSGYELLRYEVGQFYREHTDSFKDINRSVSCSFCLNDNYEGGEFSFFDNELTIKPPKGSAIMFPSNFMYPHQILPVTSGVRYSIITWFV